jgi:ribonuclease P/MRP protein subunit POP5
MTKEDWAVIYLSSATSTAIIRVSRDHVRLVWAALSFVTKLPKPFDTPCVVQVVRNSGTIRLAEEEAIKRARDVVRKARSSGQRTSLDQVLKTAVAAEEREVGAGTSEDVDMSDDD